MARESKMQHEEKRETPEQEARNHPPAFLKRAERLSERKKGARKSPRR